MRKKQTLVNNTLTLTDAYGDVTTFDVEDMDIYAVMKVLVRVLRKMEYHTESINLGLEAAVEGNYAEL